MKLDSVIEDKSPLVYPPRQYIWPSVTAAHYIAILLGIILLIALILIIAGVIHM